MNKNYIIYCLLILLLGCENKEKKIFIKKYYPSGKLFSYGWYTNDSVSIDTIHEFFENGSPSAISIYDSNGTGKLNGHCTLFYQNGKQYQQSQYVNGIVQGFSYEYGQNGNLNTKQFYLDDKPIGDNYGYDSNGILHHYAFYWIDTAYVSYIEYDISGRIKDNLNKRPVLFNYFTKIKNDTIKSQLLKNCELQIILSNPPRCRTTVRIDFISKNGFIIRSDSVENVEIYSKKYLMPDSLKKIKYTAIQYDSIIDKHYNNIGETKL
jgi:hypothetical protein